MFILAIVGLGVYAYKTTEYQIGNTDENRATLWQQLLGVRTIVLFTANFAPIASIMNVGYFLHPCAVPILRCSKTPESNTRNLFIGYSIVFFSYLIIGSVGYFAFIGTLFKNYFVQIIRSDRFGEIN